MITQGTFKSIKRSVLFSIQFILISHFMLIIKIKARHATVRDVHEYEISGLL